MTLPFTIVARIGPRNTATFVASRNGGEIATERYPLGDGEKRRRLAKRWTTDARLTGDETVEPDNVAAELEHCELDALTELDRLDVENASSGNASIDAATYTDDDMMVELAWDAECGGMDFIICDRKSGDVSRAAHVGTARGVLVPPDIGTGIVTPGTPIVGSILVPTECESSGRDELALRRDVAAFVNRYVELPGDGLHLVVEYIFFTWVFDAFDESPYLAFRTADFGRGKSRALESVGALCYRPMFVGGGSSAAATLRLLDVFGGTLVADEFDHAHDTDLAADITRILNQGFQRGRPLVRCDGERNVPRAFRCFGPKLFALRKGFGDNATESRTLTVRMRGRTRKDVPISLPRVQFDRESLALRNRLLAWRFANLGRIRIDPTLAVPDLEDRLNQIGLPLLAVARTAESRERIVDALRGQQGAIAERFADTLAGEVFAVVVDTCHLGDVIRPGEISAEVNRRRAVANKTDIHSLPTRQTVSAHLIGKVIREEFELPRLEKDRDGARYALNAERFAALCSRFGVTPPETPPTSQGHTLSETSPENPLFPPENTDCDEGDLGDLTTGCGDDGDEWSLSSSETDEPDPTAWASQ